MSVQTFESHEEDRQAAAAVERGESRSEASDWEEAVARGARAAVVAPCSAAVARAAAAAGRCRLGPLGLVRPSQCGRVLAAGAAVVAVVVDRRCSHHMVHLVDRVSLVDRVDLVAAAVDREVVVSCQAVVVRRMAEAARRRERAEEEARGRATAEEE